MDSIGKPKGLIRYASKVSIEEVHNKLITNRVKFYTAILAILLGVFMVLFSNRPSIEFKVLKVRGQMFTELPGDTIRNFYNATIINKSGQPYKNLQIKLINIDGKIITSGMEDEINLSKEEMRKLMIFVDLPKNLIKGKKKIEIGVYDNDKLVDKYKTTFMAPIK